MEDLPLSTPMSNLDAQIRRANWLMVARLVDGNHMYNDGLLACGDPNRRVDHTDI